MFVKMLVDPGVERFMMSRNNMNTIMNIVGATPVSMTSQADLDSMATYYS